LPRASLNGVTPAESGRTEVVEGNHYFPAESVNLDLFRESEARTHRPWKGDASHYAVEAGGERVEDAAWYYPAPRDAAKNIKDHVAFYADEVRIEG